MDYGVASYISEIEENLQKLPPFWHVSCEKVTILQHNRQVLSLQQLFCLMCRMTQKLAVNDFTQRGDDELCIAQYEIFSFFQTNFYAYHIGVILTQGFHYSKKVFYLRLSHKKHTEIVFQHAFLVLCFMKFLF